MTLIDFIVKAKIEGYASHGEFDELTFDDESKGFQFYEFPYQYFDRYYGFDPFSGTEQVYNTNGILIWKMNYYGKILDNKIDPKNIFQFLRHALSLVTREFPFRGPEYFEEEGLRYINIQSGILTDFNGIETIFFENQKVYHLYYHGGEM